jgi:4-amino-4-deoxy-L-arabinose transferase-like glycosyltransferase
MPRGKKTTSPFGSVRATFAGTGVTIERRQEFRSLLAMLVLALVVGGVALYGAARLAPQDGYDGPAHLEYARIIDEQGRLPTPAETYQSDTPPGFHWLAVQLHRATGSWRAAQVLSAACVALLVVVTWLLARELWPPRPGLWAAAAAVTGALPIAIRMGTMFHPEALNALLVGLAIFLVVTASRRDWPPAYAVGTGLILGLAAVTRETAVAVALGVLLGLAVTRKRRALRFAGVYLAALALVAGPWWGYQTARFGNPFYTNLVLPGHALQGGQPREFYVSAPVEDLVVHPYRPAFAGQLWPQFHADLWSDWFGGQHGYWPDAPGTATRVVLSSQSVLGLAFSVVAIAGLWFLRRWPVLLGVVAVTWIGFVVQLIRFPQAGGDPIKASYLLFLAPIFAVAAVEAGRRLPRPLVLAWCVLYAVSYAGFLVTSW